MRLLDKVTLGCAALVATTLACGDAHADPAGWTHFGAGFVGFQESDEHEFSYAPSLTIDAGVGTDAGRWFMIGGLFRLQPRIEYGTDLAWVARFATEGFQSGWIGFAIDAGPYLRTWGDGSAGIVAQGLLGGPLGLQLGVQGEYGSGHAAGFGATLGLDFARLMVHRQNVLDWWSNPRPVDRLDDHASR